MFGFDLAMDVIPAAPKPQKEESATVAASAPGRSATGRTPTRG